MSVAWVGVAATVGSSLLGAQAAGDAADAQAQSAAASDATQRYMYDTTRADNAPFLANGTAASNNLAYRLGLTSNASGGASVDRDAIRAQFLPQFTQTVAGPGVMEYRSGSGEGEGGWTMGAPTSTQSVDEAGLNAAIDREIASRNAAAVPAANTDPAYGSLLRKFTTADRDADPVYQSGLQFGLDEGEKAINRQAAATGSSLSGATLKALTRFGNDYGSTKAADAYNRFTNDQTNIYNKLAGVAGSGQTASAQVGSAGATAAGNISQSQQAVGNSRAAGYIGTANSISSGVSGAINGYQNNQLLSRIFPGGSVSVGGSSSGFIPSTGAYGSGDAAAYWQ